MGTNPNYIPPPINRLLGSIIWTSNPTLNISPEFLLPEAIGMTFGGAVTTNIAGLTNVIPSPEPYMTVELMIHIIKTSALAAAYQAAIENNAFLGAATVRTDSPGLKPYSLTNMSVVRMNPINFTGHDAGFVIACSGSYAINNALWP